MKKAHHHPEVVENTHAVVLEYRQPNTHPTHRATYTPPNQGTASKEKNERPRRRRRAQVCYYLPESWAPAYRFTVFEASYIVSFAPEGVASTSDAPFFLARKLTPDSLADEARNANVRTRAELELIWPVELDATLLNAVHRACSLVETGSKRKHESEPLMQSVEKLQRLSVRSPVAAHAQHDLLEECYPDVIDVDVI